VPGAIHPHARIGSTYTLSQKPREQVSLAPHSLPLVCTLHRLSRLVQTCCVTFTPCFAISHQPLFAHKLPPRHTADLETNG
jgi:hypothetical protein